MKPIVSTSGAFALALALLFCATAPAIAHDEHKKEAQQAVGGKPVLEEEAALPAPAAGVPQKRHDHASHGHEADSSSHSEEEEARAGNVPRPLAWLGKFHPALTHFPIALLAAAALAELLFIRTRAARYRHALLFCVRIGAGSAVVAAVLGWFFAGFRIIDEEWVMTAHRWAGTSVALFSLWLLFLAEKLGADTPAATTTRFRAVLFGAAVLVGAAGFLGGALLYGLDHYAWEVS
jgi:uncharacterized membrane protein